MGKFTVKASKSGEFYFDLKASNGEVIGKSQMYNTEEACLNGIKSVKENAGVHVEDQTGKEHPNYSHPKFEIYRGKDEQFYFRLVAKNGQNILASEGYTAKESCNKGILSVGKNAPEAPVEHEK